MAVIVKKPPRLFLNGASRFGGLGLVYAQVTNLLENGLSCAH